MATRETVVLDRQRIRELTEREEKRLNDRTGGSGRMFERANKVLSAGVASSYQLRDPWPIYFTHGQGAYVWGTGQAIDDPAEAPVTSRSSFPSPPNTYTGRAT